MGGQDMIKKVKQDSWRFCLMSYENMKNEQIERILSLCQNQQEALTYGWDVKVVVYPYGLGHF